MTSLEVSAVGKKKENYEISSELGQGCGACGGPRFGPWHTSRAGGREEIIQLLAGCHSGGLRHRHVSHERGETRHHAASEGAAGGALRPKRPPGQRRNHVSRQSGPRGRARKASGGHDLGETRADAP